MVLMMLQKHCQMLQRNFQEVLEGFKRSLASPDTPANELASSLSQAVQCLGQLNRLDEFDALVESAVEMHNDKWQLLSAAATEYTRVTHHGFLVSGKFERGPHRGGGKVIHATDRDRARALQLLLRALDLAEAAQQVEAADQASIAEQLASTLLEGRSGSGSWRLQVLTDLDTLPDYQEGWGYDDGTQGAPVDADNNPIFYGVPESLGQAASDGERWRWALARMVDRDTSRRYYELITRADFLRSQFGVTTLGDTIRPLLARPTQARRQKAACTRSTHSRQTKPSLDWPLACSASNFPTSTISSCFTIRRST